MKTEGDASMEDRGNNIFSRDEEEIAESLKRKNLAHANAIAKEVHPRDTLYTRYVKRILDLVIVVPVLIVLLPVYLLLGILNLAVMGRPIFYRQTRCGYKGKHFDVLKFRSMKDITDEEGRQLPPEQRLTKYGRFIRKFSLDELPNLLNILRGEMSIIGPRPLPVFYIERMSERHRMLCATRPGLECPRMIQVEDGDLFKYHRTFENNVWYVENVSFLLDVKMILHLVGMVFSFKERGRRAGAAEVTYFVGYDEKGRAISLSHYRKMIVEREEKVSV